MAVAAGTATVHAHSGPPYPVVSRQAAGMYLVSVWTDPDATDDGTAGGQFWIVIEPARTGATLPPDTRAQVTVRALDRSGPDAAPAAATPVDGDLSRQFVAVRMDHEGPYRVHVWLDGAWGTAGLDAQVEATYDLRPPLGLLGIYLLPFVAVGFLWTRLLLRRRRSRTSRTT
jgi:hypothetical protein